MSKLYDDIMKKVAQDLANAKAFTNVTLNGKKYERRKENVQ